MNTLALASSEEQHLVLTFVITWTDTRCMYRVVDEHVRGTRVDVNCSCMVVVLLQ